MKHKLVLTIGVLVGMITVCSVGAQEEPMMADSAQNEIMTRMKDYATPNEHHQLLAALVGQWTVETSMWMAPGAEPMVTSGSSEAWWIYNGLFIEQTFNGDHMGVPFIGKGIMGYDSIAEQYQYLWMDNMSSGMVLMKVEYDPATKSFEQHATVSCPITNGPREMRAKLTIIDDDHYTNEFYMNDLQSAEETLTMKISYTRVK